LWKKIKSAAQLPGIAARIALAGAVLALAAGCSILPKEEDALKPPLVKPLKENLELVEVTRGTITKELKAIGSFVPSRSEQVFYKQSGHLLSAIYVKLGDKVEKGDVIAELDQGDLELSIAKNKLALERAGINLKQMIQEGADDADGIRLKEIEYEQIKLEYDDAIEKLARTKLIAPISGVVSFLTDIKGGDPVAAYDPVATISELDQMYISYESNNQEEFTGIEVGMDADVKIGEELFKGKVVQTPTSAIKSFSLQQLEVLGKLIIISVPNLPPQLELGDNVEFTVKVLEKSDVLTIPRSGLRNFGSHYFVQVLEGESRKEIDVQPGLMTSIEAEIVRGLKEGQKVILNKN